MKLHNANHVEKPPVLQPVLVWGILPDEDVPAWHEGFYVPRAQGGGLWRSVRKDEVILGFLELWAVTYWMEMPAAPSDQPEVKP